MTDDDLSYARTYLWLLGDDLALARLSLDNSQRRNAEAQAIAHFTEMAGAMGFTLTPKARVAA